MKPSPSFEKISLKPSPTEKTINDKIKRV